MSETKLDDKKGAHSEKFSLASEIFARLAKLASEIFLIFLIFFF